MVISPEQHYFMDTEDGEDVGQWRLAVCTTGGLYMVGRGVKNESYRFVCAVVVFMDWVSLVMEHQKLLKKVNSSEAELDLKISIFGTRCVMSFVPITSYRNEI